MKRYFGRLFRALFNHPQKENLPPGYFKIKLKNMPVGYALIQYDEDGSQEIVPVNRLTKVEKYEN